MKLQRLTLENKWRNALRIYDFATLVPTEGSITLKNKKFSGWKVVITTDINMEYYHNDKQVDDWEESDDKYRLLMAMRQSDTWEKVNVPKSDNK